MKDEHKDFLIELLICGAFAILFVFISIASWWIGKMVFK